MPISPGESQRVRRGVIGIIARGDEYLVVRRAEGIARGGCWCFPGGHVERAETPKAAIIREMHEELGITVRPVRRLGSLRVLTSRHVLVAWMVAHVQGKISPAPAEVAECRWVTLREIAELHPGLPSNGAVAEMLQKELSNGD